MNSGLPAFDIWQIRLTFKVADVDVSVSWQCQRKDSQLMVESQTVS